MVHIWSFALELQLYVRPVYQKSTCSTQLTLRMFVVQDLVTRRSKFGHEEVTVASETHTHNMIRFGNIHQDVSWLSRDPCFPDVRRADQVSFRWTIWRCALDKSDQCLPSVYLSRPFERPVVRVCSISCLSLYHTNLSVL